MLQNKKKFNVYIYIEQKTNQRILINCWPL